MSRKGEENQASNRLGGSINRSLRSASAGRAPASEMRPLAAAAVRRPAVGGASGRAGGYRASERETARETHLSAVATAVAMDALLCAGSSAMLLDGAALA